MKLNNLLNESSLSRVWKHNEEHDCGAIAQREWHKIQMENVEWLKP
jgi:hypothetical protein